MSALLVHDTLIALHAAGGAVCFVSGVFLIVPSTRSRAHLRWLFTIFLASLALMLVPLYLVIAVDWVGLDISRQVAFTALGILGLYMAWRAFQARNVLRTRPEAWRLKFIDHIGFNLISLFAGFVIVSAIDLGAPSWLVGVIAVSGVAAGIVAVNFVKSRERTS